ncbi:MFS transporter [Pseudomonas sp. Marseille-QA0892]
MNTSSSGPTPLSSKLVLFLAFCCGAIVANIYYAQPIIELIAPSIALSDGSASLIVSLTQIGYALGLLLLVPLADLLENRRLVIATTLGTAVALAAAGWVEQPAAFLLLSLLIGVTSVSVQILVPLAAHLAPEASRGRVVGNIMSGLLLGILLARPLSGVIADHFGWRAVFLSAALLMALIALAVRCVMPVRQPDHRASYGALLLSLVSLIRREPVLRKRALYQALLFGAFSLFWTAVPFELTRNHGLSQSEIALFALVGAVGALSAPLAGRLADAGHTQRATMFAMTLAAVSFVPPLLGTDHAIIALAMTGVVLDFAVQMNMVLGQRAIYALDPQSRGRLNALYMSSIFIGGAIGSAAASALYATYGWPVVALFGGALGIFALLLFVVHSNRQAAVEMA